MTTRPCSGCAKPTWIKNSSITDSPTCVSCRREARRSECRRCLKIFYPSTPQKYCSRSCSDAVPKDRCIVMGVCTDCGTEDQVTGLKVPLCPGCRAVRSAALKIRRAAATKRWRAVHPEHDRDKSRRRRAVKLGAPSEKYTTEEIAERDGRICRLCLEPVDTTLPGNDRWGPTVDHIVALSNGGTDMKINVQLSHWICNVIKGDAAP